MLLVTSLLLYVFAFSTMAMNEQSTFDVSATPQDNLQESIFEKYGISPDLPKLGITSLSQGDNIVEHVNRVITIDGNEHKAEVFLVQTIDKIGNIDLRIKYHPNNFTDDKNVVDEIEKITKTEYLLRSYSQSYDPKSVNVIETGDNKVVVSFNYSKYQLPQDIAYFRFMHVDLEVVDKKPSQMVITNNKPFFYQGHYINDYRQVIHFAQLADGVTTIDHKVIEAKGSYNTKPSSIKIKIKTVAIYDDELGDIVVDEKLLSEVSDPRIREQKVALDRMFPLMADLVRRQGIDVPLPYGVSLAYREQNLDVDFNSFDIMGVNLDHYFDPGSSFGEVSAKSLSLRGDINILPFWNVFAVVGKVDVDAFVDASYTGNIKTALEERFGKLGAALACKAAQEAGADVCNPGRVKLPLDLDYDVVGLGTTLAVGYKEIFASVTATYTSTRLKGHHSWGDTIATFQPIIGYQLLDYRAQVFIGGEYQDLKANMEGNLGPIEGLNRDFTYDVGVKLHKWAYLVGFNKQIGKHYNLTVLYNKGDTRDALTVSLGYRF
ncbi:hypothetical protein [Colwellia sp. MEBiC06753]